MQRRSVLAFLLSSFACVLAGAPRPALADEGPRISGPFVHENLAIYFLHGPSAPGAVPLTLQEALAKRGVVVHETGNVNELQIENTGSEEVFVQSGDIVKGGKQDRVLTVSLLVPPRSGRVQIASFCVEQGRWSSRGRESAARFESADAAMPSRKAKMAMKAPRPAEPNGSPETAQRQQEVWANVTRTQQLLSRNVGQAVASPQSRSSLQLALEHEKLMDAKASYVSALKGKGEETNDVIGLVFAVDGKLNSADVYPSNALFRKMWAKLLQAAVTEAVAEKSASGEAPPSVAQVKSFLAGAEAGAPSLRELTQTVALETRDAETGLYFETRRKVGSWVHRNYLAK